MESIELYSADVEHSFEDCKLVIDLQDKECSRRVEDVNGEIKRRLLAREVSNLIIPPVLQEQSECYPNLWNMVNEAGRNFMEYTQTIASNVTSGLSEFAGRKGFETSEALRLHMGIVGLRGISSALLVKDIAEQKASQLTYTISDIAGEVGRDSGIFIKDKLGDAARDLGITPNNQVGYRVSQNAKTFAKERLDNVEELAHESKLMLKLANTNPISQNATKITYHSKNAGLLFQEDTERTYRLSNEDEVYAILNGLALSSLIKDLGEAFYRPSYEPTRIYSTKLLEQYERSSRLSKDVGPIVNQAREVSKLVEDKFSNSTSVPSSSLVAAKAEYLDQIKHNVSVIGVSAM